MKHEVPDRAFLATYGTFFVLTVGIFVVDILTPRGVIPWMLYIIPLALTFVTPRKRDLLLACGLFTVLVWLGFALSPPAEPVGYAALNRVLGLVAMWAFAGLMVRHRLAREHLIAAASSREMAIRTLSETEDRLGATEQAKIEAEAALTESEEAKSEAQRERQRAQDKVLGLKLRLDGIVQTAMDAIITVDEEQLIVLFNHAAEEMFQCKADDALGRSLDRFIPERYRALHHDHIERFAQSGVTNRKMQALGQVTGVRPTGEEFPMEAAISQVSVDHKKYFTVILRDITERLQVQKALAERERMLSTLISNLPGVVYRCKNDPVWTVTYISDQVGDMLGVSAREFTSRRISWAELIHSEDRERIWEEVQAALKECRSYQLEYRMRRKDGGQIWVWEQGRGVHDGEGKVLALEGFITDITRRKEADRMLRLSEERYRRLVEVSPDAIFVHREERIIFANQQAIDLLGAKDADQIIGRSPLEFVHPDYHEAILERSHRIVHGVGQGPPHEERFTRLDGTVINVEVTASAFHDDEGPAIQVVVRDVTQRKQMEERLRKAERLAELGTLASGMAHEIGTPMNVILGRAEYLIERTKDETIKKGLQTIVAQVERITRVMNQLLSFARRRPPERRPLDLRRTIEDGLEMFQQRLAQHGIKVETSLAGPSLLVQADADQMSQVLINLLANAIHAMPDGGTLRTVLAPVEEMVKLAVSDTGHGMPEEVVARIFDPFFTTKEFGKGTGLGLTVVKGIIDEHGGSIMVDSEPGKGTTFTILLPRSQ